MAWHRTLNKHNVMQMTFHELHEQDQPLLLSNVWDVPSAKAAEKAGYQAIATSSAAVANMLGYPDGEGIPFAELAYVVKRIAACTSLPLSVDLEAGYSRDNDQVVRNIQALLEVGIVGINLEDSIVTDSGRSLEDATRFAERLNYLKTKLAENDQDIFINARTDVFILQHPKALEVAKRRAALYEQAGADGIFIPFCLKPEEIAAVTASTSLPVNVLANTELPDLATLGQLGVRRVSLGDYPFAQMCSAYAKGIARIKNEQSLTSLFA